MFEDGVPIFVQLADQLAGNILDGSYNEGDQVPSINELARFYRINPATANRAVAILVDEQILEKRRGIGMFVADGAKARIADKRRGQLIAKYIQPLLAETRTLGIATVELIELIERQAENDGSNPGN